MICQIHAVGRRVSAICFTLPFSYKELALILFAYPALLRVPTDSESFEKLSGMHIKGHG